MTTFAKYLFGIGLAALLIGCSGADADPGKTPGSSGDVDSGQSVDAGNAEGGSQDAGNPMPDAGVVASDGGDAATDGGDAGNTCEVFGAPGQCMLVSACAAIPDHSSFSGACPGPASVECCIDTPDVADNPPVPTGWVLMTQAQVTPAMTTWAVSILHDPITYPMYSTTIMPFGSLMVLARVEWHPPDFQNSVVHRGVTLYVPA